MAPYWQIVVGLKKRFESTDVTRQTLCILNKESSCMYRNRKRGNALLKVNALPRMGTGRRGNLRVSLTQSDPICFRFWGLYWDLSRWHLRALCPVNWNSPRSLQEGVFDFIGAWTELGICQSGNTNDRIMTLWLPWVTLKRLEHVPFRLTPEAEEVRQGEEHVLRLMSGC